MQDFHKLKVWEKSHALAMEVYRVTESFPRRDGVALTTQLRRAALSVPTNIAEGAGKFSESEFRRFLEIALGSAAETTTISSLPATSGSWKTNDTTLFQGKSLKCDACCPASSSGKGVKSVGERSHDAVPSRERPSTTACRQCNERRR